MRLNDTQIRRLIQHACDKTGHEHLSGGISFYFIEGKLDYLSRSQCEPTAYGYSASFKIAADNFENLSRDNQIKVVIQAACQCIDLYRVKAMSGKPQKYGVSRLVRKCGVKPIKQVVS